MIKFWGGEGAGGATIDGERWLICNEEAKKFCMCHDRGLPGHYPGKHEIRESTVEAVTKAYKEGLFADPFAMHMSERCFNAVHCLTLRRTFK